MFWEKTKNPSVNFFTLPSIFLKFYLQMVTTRIIVYMPNFKEIKYITEKFDMHTNHNHCNPRETPKTKAMNNTKIIITHGKIERIIIFVLVFDDAKE